MIIARAKMYANQWFSHVDMFFLSKWSKTNCAIWHKGVGGGFVLNYQFEIEYRRNQLLCTHIKPIIWHAKISQMLFSTIQERLTWIGLWSQRLPYTSRCIYKMLVACTHDKKGRNLLTPWMLCFFYYLKQCDGNQTWHSWYKNIYFLFYELIPYVPVQN